MSKEPYELDGLTPVEEEDRFEAADGAAEEVPAAANGKKKKKPWSKKKKVIVGVVSGVIAAILIAVIVVVCVLFSGESRPVAFDQTNYVVDMGNTYYVGTEGDYDQSLASGKDVTTVDGAYNVSTYEDFYQKLKEGKDVVVHASEFTMLKDKDHGTINVKSDIYGNGVSINAYDLVQGNTDTWGQTAFLVEGGSEALIRDMKVYGKPMDPDDNLKTFTAYGSLLNIAGDDKKKARAEIYHCIFENSHKVVHMQSAIVYMEGCLVRNAADTAISIGTFKNQATDFTSKNNIVADSLTGGILTYCYDGNVDESADNADTWNNIYIEGFLDIYNWKKASELVFIPDTELSGNTGLIATLNSYLSGEIVLPQYADMRVDYENDAYVHFGILRIATNGYGHNKAKIYYDNKELTEKTVKTDNALGYTVQSFPIPPIGSGVMKELYVMGYFSNNEETVKVGDKVANRADFYKTEMGIVEKK